MSAEEFLRNGDLHAALDALQKTVKGDPSSASNRVFLFQLLAVTGSWGRALTQLNVAGELDAGTLAMVQAYRELLRCESLRKEVFDGQRAPTIFGDPEEWIALALQALKCFASNELAKARAYLDQALESAPVTSGNIDGQPFEWLADGDSRLGPILEVYLNGAYYWVPLHRIRRIVLEKPVDLRDLVWAPVQFEWSNGGQAVGFIPVRYPGSELSDDSAIRLARQTTWDDRGSNVFFGLGQRTFMTESEQFPLLEARQIVFDVPDADWD